MVGKEKCLIKKYLKTGVKLIGKLILRSIISIFLFSPFTLASTTVKIGIEYTCPYYCDPKDETHKGKEGYIADILKSFEKEYQYKIIFLEIPKARHLLSLAQNNIDLVLFSTHQVNDNKSIQHINIPMGISSFGVATRDDFTKLILSISDLKGKRFAYPIGVFADQIEQNNRPDKKWMQISGKNIYDRLFKLLTNKRTQIIGGDYNSLKYESLVRDHKKIIVTPTSFIGHNPFLFAKARNNQKLSTKFTQQLKEHLKKIRKSGKLKQILNRYNINDWNYKTTR